MLTALTPVAALLISVAVLLAGNGLQGTLLPIRAQMEDFSTLSIGVLGSVYFAGFAAGCLLGPKLIERVGHIRTFSAMAAIATAAILGHGLYAAPLLWWVLRALSGFCFAVLYVVIESWLNERATRETRGLVLSVYLIINLTVITLGQLMVTLADPQAFTLFAVAAILLSLGLVPVATTRTIAPSPPPAVRPRLRRLYATSPVGFMGCLTVGLANGAFWALSPVFAAGSGMDTRGIALLMSATVVGGAIGQWPLGRMSDRMDRRYVVVACCGGAAMVAAALTFAPFAAPWALFALSGLWGAFAFPLYAISVAHTNDFAAPQDYVEVSSGLLLLYGAGAAVGPVLVAPLLEVIGPGALFEATMGIHLLLAGFALMRVRHRGPAPLEEHVTFDEAAQAALTMSGAFQTGDADAGEPPRRQPARTTMEEVG